MLRAWMPRESGLSHISVLDGQGASAVKDIRLQRARTIDAGQSIEIAVGPDSSLCWPRVTTICELVFVRYPTDGTLMVRVEGGAAPTVRWRDDVGEGSLSIPVSTEDFSSAGITLEWPAGTPSQRALMTTSFRPL